MGTLRSHYPIQAQIKCDSHVQVPSNYPLPNEKESWTCVKHFEQINSRKENGWATPSMIPAPPPKAQRKIKCSWVPWLLKSSSNSLSKVTNSEVHCWCKVYGQIKFQVVPKSSIALTMEPSISTRNISLVDCLFYLARHLALLDRVFQHRICILPSPTSWLTLRFQQSS